MDKAPLVSVLVTPYNQKDYIRQTLDSILMQKCRFNFEVVIGEDCSTDGTREICLEYASAYPDKIVLCLNERNKGLLNNYFDVFLKANGTYIADCGGDDYWLTDSKLQEQVDLLEAHPEVSLVAGNWQLYDQKSNTFQRPKSWIENDWFQPNEYGIPAIAKYLNSNDMPRIVLAASCFRGDWAREIYHAAPELFRGHGIVCEDLPLTLGLLLRGPFYISKNNWLVYRVLEKSLSHAKTNDSYMKGFAFSAYKQTLELVQTLGVQLQDIQPYALSKAGDFTLHAFLNKDAAFSNAVQKALKEQGLKSSFKNRILHRNVKGSLIAPIIRAYYENKLPKP